MGITEKIINGNIEFTENRLTTLKQSNGFEDKLMCIEYQHSISVLKTIKRLHLEELQNATK